MQILYNIFFKYSEIIRIINKNSVIIIIKYSYKIKIYTRYC